ncbi:putative 2-oxoglutarate/Fe(II)-dependent dioxygenase YbiX [Kineosphaera limosa]|uniref:Fe2OG dioxygenase domain-containing protein n=1 Tax=Kineosphaera limosa NBRC 100340 TaxID=1184609 RepID=K6WCH4_9MICO|nr:2OG-Fe(II) oxygenase [Kineosphaera limosa]NYE00843.1 putative 2-oxoglutarate/Fe(II)-dependent dioxygenase YbiX [Kineosphaera limosa]GAB96970.1 hypothetical protein KILIM_053_00210 [Kineosphaera limosa NBRC 100340]
MTTKDLDELALLLGGGMSARSSAALPKREQSPTVTVAGFGELRLPLTAATARRLVAKGEAAPFGKGEETLLDTSVRHTWHFPRTAVDVDWHGQLDDILDEARRALALPVGCRLEAEFHSLLVYERGQFFAQHQDSEKDDAMVATLVVVLQSPSSGGELVVHGPEGPSTYAGSRDATTMVALYADAVHEVLPVRTGHRVALTYNLLLRGDTAGQTVGGDAVAEAETLLNRHFTTAVKPRYGGEAATPTRVAYLLDHSYTPRALVGGMGRLKGVDAERAAILREAAARAGCEVVLALADVHETRDDGYGGDESLIDSEVTITHARAADGTVEEPGILLTNAELTATTPSRALRAYAREHQGYMGNYGNTIDRWYHRGALLVWPTHLAFANRVRAAPAAELRTALRRLAEHDDSATRDIAGLLPIWPDVVSSLGYRHLVSGEPSGVSHLFADAMALASHLDDETMGDALLHPFAIDDLSPEGADSLLGLADTRGPAWTRARISRWFSPEARRSYGGLSENWVEDLPELTRALRQRPDLTSLLLQQSWAWLRPQLPSQLAATSTTTVRSRLADLGKLLASVMGAVAEADGAADEVRAEVIAWCSDEASDSLLDLLLPALNAAGAWPAARIDKSGLRDLARVASDLLEQRANSAPREVDDWSIHLPAGCSCDLCEKLVGFLANPAARVLEWPIAKQGRQHLHHRLDGAELPVTHVTRRQGSPYVLVLRKTADLFEADARRRSEAEQELRRIAKTWWA